MESLRKQGAAIMKAAHAFWVQIREDPSYPRHPRSIAVPCEHKGRISAVSFVRTAHATGFCLPFGRNPKMEFLRKQGAAVRLASPTKKLVFQLRDYLKITARFSKTNIHAVM